MHKSLAEVVNRFKDAEERGRKATQAHGAEIKKPETSSFASGKNTRTAWNVWRTPSRGCIACCRARGRTRTPEEKRARGHTDAAAGGSRVGADAEVSAEESRRRDARARAANVAVV